MVEVTQNWRMVWFWCILCWCASTVSALDGGFP